MSHTRIVCHYRVYHHISMITQYHDISGLSHFPIAQPYILMYALDDCDYQVCVDVKLAVQRLKVLTYAKRIFTCAIVIYSYCTQYIHVIYTLDTCVLSTMCTQTCEVYIYRFSTSHSFRNFFTYLHSGHNGNNKFDIHLYEK